MLVNVHEKGYTNTNTSDPSFRIFTVCRVEDGIFSQLLDKLHLQLHCNVMVTWVWFASLYLKHECVLSFLLVNNFEKAPFVHYIYWKSWQIILDSSTTMKALIRSRTSEEMDRTLPRIASLKIHSGGRGLLLHPRAGWGVDFLDHELL